MIKTVLLYYIIIYVITKKSVEIFTFFNNFSIHLDVSLTLVTLEICT